MNDIDELLGHLGIAPTDGGSTEPVNNPTNDEDPTADPTPTEPTESPVTPPQENPPQADDKTSQAFAQMRIENKKLQQMMKGMSDLLGVEGDPDKVLETVQSKLLEAKSKKDNVPLEVLQRLNHLEGRDAEFTKVQLEQKAFNGFQQVRELFKLDDAGVTQYINDLALAGLNPFETQVDLVADYKTRNFDKILQKHVDDAIRAEQQRALAAINQGSTPGQAQGQGGNTGSGESINTVNKLTDFFNSLQK